MPTSADDVFFDANSGGGTVTNTGGSVCVCRNLDMTGFTGVTSSGSTVVMTSPTVLKLSTANAWGFFATLATGATLVVTSNGRSMATLTISGTATSVASLADALNVTGALTINNGAFVTNSNAVTAGSFASSATNNRTLTLGASSVTITGTASNTWNTSTITNLIVTANTATITFTGASSVTLINAGGLNFNGSSIAVTGTGQPIVSGLTCANFTRTGIATKTDAVQFTSALTVTGTLSLTGNSSTNRLLVASNLVGTARTITAAAVSISNADFADIIGAGAASWNLSAITGGSGDAGGNSGITFTASATQTRTGAGGNWSTAASWTSRAPLPQDDVTVAGAASGTITADMPRLGRSLNFTGFTGTLTQSTNNLIYGSLVLGTGMSITATGLNFTLRGRGAFSITSNGVVVPGSGGSLTIDAPGGTYTHADAAFWGATISVLSGTWDTNGMSTRVWAITTSGTATRGITFRTSTVTLAASSSVVFSATGSGLTASLASSTIVVGTAAAVARSFIGGGLTYGTLSYTIAASTGTLLITASNTFGTLDVGSGRTLQFAAGTTQTVAAWNVNGASGAPTTVNTDTAGSAATVSTPNTLHAKYLTLQDIAGAGVGVKNARRSTIVSNVTGWNVAMSAKLYRSGGVFRVKPHRVKVGGVMVEKLDRARVGGVMVP